MATHLKLVMPLYISTGKYTAMTWKESTNLKKNYRTQQNMPIDRFENTMFKIYSLAGISIEVENFKLK